MNTNQLKAKPFYIFTPECGVAWSHLVKPDTAFNKPPEWSVTLLLDPDQPETTRVYDEFMKGLDEWKLQLKTAFPKQTFKMGEHSRFGFTEFEGRKVMEIKCRKTVEAGQGANRFQNTPPVLVDKYGTPITGEEREKFMKGLDEWKLQLKTAFPKQTFKMGEHSRFGFTEFEGRKVMEIKCRKTVEAGQGANRFQNTPPVLVDKYGTPITGEEREKYVGLGRGTTVQAKLRVQGYNHPQYGVGLTVQPEAIVLMNFVPYEKTTDLSGFKFQNKNETQDLTPSNVENSYGGSTF